MQVHTASRAASITEGERDKTHYRVSSSDKISLAVAHSHCPEVRSATAVKLRTWAG